MHLSDMHLSGVHCIVVTIGMCYYCYVLLLLCCCWLENKNSIWIYFCYSNSIL